MHIKQDAVTHVVTMDETQATTIGINDEISVFVNPS